MSVYVRARDGALYKDPLWVFPEGFICFDDTEPPELVLWLDLKMLEAASAADVDAILRRVFGFVSSSELCSAVPGSAFLVARSQRVIPGTDPPQLNPADSYFFEAVARPPRPTINDGTERHASRVKGRVWDWPAGAYDASSLEIPKRD